MKKFIILGALAFLAAGCGSASTSTTAGVISPVKISEWTVEFTPTKNISDVRYVIDPNHSDTADFSSASLVSLDQQTGGGQCAIADAPLGSLTRVVNFSAFTSSGHTIPANIQIGQYYYYYTEPQGSCSSNQAVQNMQNLQAADLSSALASLIAVPK